MMFHRVLRPEGKPPSLRFRPPSLHIPLWLLALGWLGVAAWRVLRWLVLHPRTTGTGLLTGWLAVVDLLTLTVGLVLVLACGVALWWALDPQPATGWVIDPARLRARRWWVYGRNWQPAMLTAGLSLRESWGGDLPTLRRVSSDAGRDVLRVRMLPGQTQETWSAAAAALAQTFGARAVRVRRVAGRPQELDLLVTRRNGAMMRHVTDSTPVPVQEDAPAPRGAFPRQARGGGAA